MTPTPWLRRGTAVIAALLLSTALPAIRAVAQEPSALQDASATPVDDALSVADAEARLALLEAALGSAAADPVVLSWRETLALLRAEASFLAQRDALLAKTLSAPQDLERARADLAALPLSDAPPDLSRAAGAGQRDLEALVAEASAATVLVEGEVKRVSDERTLRSERLRDIPAAIAGVRAALDAPADGAGPPADPVLAEALGFQQQAGRRALLAELQFLEAERDSYEARRDLLTARQDLALRRLALAQAQEAGLAALAEQARATGRAAEARQAELALQEARGRHPLLVELAARSSELSQRVLASESRQAADLARLEHLRAENARVQAEHAAVKEKEESLGFSNALGLILRRNRKGLPDPAAFRTREDAAAAVELQELLLQLEDERAELTDLDRWVARRMVGAATGLGFDDPQALGQELRAQAAGYREKLDGALDLAQRGVDVLAEMSAGLDTLERGVADYARYIDERILWVPSTRAVSLGSLGDVPAALRELLAPASYRHLLSALRAEVARRPVADGAAVLVLLALVVVRLAIRRRLPALAEQARRGMGQVLPSAVALVLTLGKALTLPVLLWFLGWRLGGEPVLATLAESLRATGTVLLPLTLLLAACAPDGLLTRHFRWPAEACQSMARRTRTLAALVVPLLALWILINERDEPQIEASLGRALLLGAIALVGWYLLGLLRPGGAVDQVQASALRGGLGPRLRAWSRALSLALALLLVALTLTGYQLAARVLLAVWIDTALVVLLLVLARGFLLLFLAVQARRLRAEQRRRAREVAGAPEDESGVSEDEAQLDVAQVSSQAQRLLRAGLTVAFLLSLLAIWSDALPALAWLDEVKLLERSVEVEVPDGAGGSVTQVGTDVLSLADLLAALFTLAVTVVAVRNLPGLLDISLLSHLPLEPGTGYAVKSITRYALLTAGGLFVLHLIGVTWESMRWLVAAMSVGLGFGLQEVFANFICGLILLFERPVRVGDIVTVGGTEGTVTRIQMRATTIRDWNRKELLVPNRRFITEEVTNWTLTDPITRLVFPIGVAYGSDVELVTKTLLDVARAEPLVLDTPAPSVVFRRFGASNLEFELRVFLSDFDGWPKLTHNINTAIDRAFREAGLVMAAPQFDVNVKVAELGAGAAATERLGLRG